ncbi:MAG TPA: hypothetical protein VII52_00020 [Gemmatimonadaceae bacterium]
MPRSSSPLSSRARPSGGTPLRRAWPVRAIPWAAVVTSALVLITAVFSVDAIRDAVSLESVAEARLQLSAAYLSIAPISNVLDTLTLLTVGQHIAVVLWVIGAFGIWRVIRARRRPTRRGTEVLVAACLVAAITLTYVVGALMPRPMAQLAVSDATVIVVDFHSHTMYSHDGRPGWTEEDVRNWHRAAGYDVAYITDHATFEGAERGIASNPGLAGEGTTILQGLEVVYRGEHVNILSAGRRYRGLTTPDLRDMDVQSLQLAGFLRATAPVLVETVPAHLSQVPARTNDAPGVDAIEIVDGSPRGLAEDRRDRRQIVHIADSLNLALVAGSDNHGWGHTAPGWTLLRVPGWRGMRTDSLSRRLEDVLRGGRRQAARTVERRVAAATNPVAVGFAAPLVAWRMLTTLSTDERVMWLIWAWGLVLLARGLRAYRIRPSATT